MKKIFIISMCVAALASCNMGKNSPEYQQAQAQIDSLKQVLGEKDDELDGIMQCINDVQDGFRAINEAEGRITIADGNRENASARQTINENMQFIQESMEKNRAMIAQLQEKLKNSSMNIGSLQKTIANLQTQLEEQTQRIQELEASLAEKEAVIEKQGAQIDNLNENVNTLTQENQKKSQTVAKQDQELNKAWFVFGTRSELKEQKILQSGEVLKGQDFNKDYFTQIDIRAVREINLYSKSATVKTTHPADSYQLVKNPKGEYTLKITNPTKFWSISKYLVVVVK